MLKINPKKDIKELEKFGFKPKYDEDTGKIKAYEKVMKEYMGLTVTIETTKTKIRIFKQREEWKINPYNDYFDLDTLYDLIIADMVVKE